MYIAEITHYTLEAFVFSRKVSPMASYASDGPPTTLGPKSHAANQRAPKTVIIPGHALIARVDRFGNI